MNCGCIKNIGCFVPNDAIKFGFVAPCSADYTFEIFGVGGFSTMTASFDEGEEIEIPFAFNENAETIIKIRVPECAAIPGFYYFTTPDGACSFEVSGISSSGGCSL